MYDLVTKVRNSLYDNHCFASYRFQTPTLCIGNLRVGGTGKSPFVEYLIRYYLTKGIKIAILSRGYGRKTKGFIQASSKSSSIEIGDEPFQYFHKFGNSVDVFVGENRTEALARITGKENALDLVLLDDAFQHRRLEPKVSILLTEFSRPFYKDYLLPMGRLRESRNGARRSRFVVVTKCPPLIEPEVQYKIEDEIRKYSGNNVPIFFAYIKYGEWKPFNSSTLPLGKPQEVVVMCGIDNPKPFLQYCQSQFDVKEEHVYPDHHLFTTMEIEKLVRSGLPIVTTEKDISRLALFAGRLAQTKIGYIPIEVGFCNAQQETEFLKQLGERINA